MSKKLWIFILVLICSLWVTLAGQAKEVAGILDEIEDRVKLARRTTDKQSVNCKKAYKELYSRKQLTTYFIFGYKDSRPHRFVADQLEKMVLVEHITKSCTGIYPVCGFKRNTTKGELFEKEFTAPTGETTQLQVWIIDSSVGFDDSDNRQNPFQLWKSSKSQQAFEQGLKTGDIVFYNGHSRSGGGPDFTPPILKTKSSEVNYKVYRHNKAGLKLIQKAIDLKNQPQAQLLGLFSCVSGEHFSEGIKAINPKISLLTSEVLLYYTDALRDSVASYAGILNGYCRREMRGALQSDRGLSGSRLTGFFK